MQKQKLEFFLAIQATYDLFEIGLFNQTTCVDKVQEDKVRASKDFIPLLDSLLRRNQVALSDLQFIAVNQGPGLFSVLRSLITFANSLSFARQLPLVGIDGLAALVDEHRNPNGNVTVALLNAFNGEVYFAIAHGANIMQTGYNTIASVLATVQDRYQGQDIWFIGNGVELYRAEIKEFFADAQIPDPLPQTVSLQHVGILGLHLWHKSACTNQLFPLYLKQHSAQIALAKSALDPAQSA